MAITMSMNLKVLAIRATARNEKPFGLSQKPTFKLLT